jgi:hypothetical protein
MDTPACHHVVQFYGNDPRPLVSNVSRYIAEADGSHCGLLIATPEHRAAIVNQLDRDGYDPDRAMAEGRLVLFDAEETLGVILENGQPDWDRFQAVVVTAVRELQARFPGVEIRAYGEMVALFWNSGRGAQAERLEEFWNRFLSESGISLFCAYQIDIFGPEFQAGVLNGVLCRHTHVVSADGNNALHRAVYRAIDEVLGERAEGLKRLIAPNCRPAWADVPPAESTILWLRNNLPDCAGEILTRAAALSTGGGL